MRELVSSTLGKLEQDFVSAAFQAQERPHRRVEEKQKRIEFLEKGADQGRGPGRADGRARRLKKSLGEV